MAIFQNKKEQENSTLTQNPSSTKERKKDLSFVFNAQTIAVIGASPNPEKLGHEILKNIIEAGYAGKIFPIHPTAPKILDLPVFPSIKAVPQKVDFAVIVVPADFVAQILEECGQAGVKAAAVISSGFAEIGKIEEEKKLKSIADQYQMALLGPNMFGIVYAPRRLNASFGPRNILPGKIAFISQSGALAIALMGWTVMEKIGLSSLVNVGNKADIEEKDLIEYFNHDSNVEVILIYMEGVKDGRKFMAAEIKKPTIVLKVGRSKRGAKAASSHTGSLSGSDKIYDAAFKQLGILRAASFTEAFGWARALSLPFPTRKETIIITNGGGIGVRATDECEEAGIPLLDDPQWLESQFRRVMPYFGSSKNPVDLTGQAGAKEYQKAAQIAFQEERIGTVIFLYCETAITDPLEIAKVITEEFLLAKIKKPAVIHLVGGERTREALNFLNENGIPAFNSVSEAVSSLKILNDWKEISEQPKDAAQKPSPPLEVLQMIDEIKKEDRPALMEHEAREILELCGVPVPAWGFARNKEEALSLASSRKLFPLAMKITSPDIIHKTDVGGVVLNIKNEKELQEKFEEMMERVCRQEPQAKILGVNLIQMIKGIECIVGMTVDPQFGPAVMFGLGGIFVEVLKDVEFRIVPFGPMEASRKINDIKGKEILQGFRGMKANQESIIKTLCAIQKLAGLVKEVDINPLMTNEQGSFAVDARIIL